MILIVGDSDIHSYGISINDCFSQYVTYLTYQALMTSYYYYIILLDGKESSHLKG